MSEITQGVVVRRFLDCPAGTEMPDQIVWALGELERCIVERFDGMGTTEFSPPELILSLSKSDAFIEAAGRMGVTLPDAEDSFALFEAEADGRRQIHAYGADLRGLVYAVMELADRVRYAASLDDALTLPTPLVETPVAKVRSISRCFQSVAEDLPWFHDREGWCEYLTHLVTHRFNRVSMTMGMQYNYPYGNEFISDVYFHFAYPFLVQVPGHNVEAEGLTAAEREKNLDTLRFIAAEARRRGLSFHLALWTQSYDFANSPNANYQIKGVTKENRAAYCRDALAIILAEVPDITGLTLRVHVECGIPEGSYDFWETYFEAVTGCGRTIQLDLHAKGIDERMIQIALGTGMPVCISPKYTSEHMGLPYHQASIRALELETGAGGDGGAGRDMKTLYSGPDAAEHEGTWRFSEGARKFMRYSYGDLLKDGRPYDVVYRIWPGTMRVLLWGDPVLAGGYGRHSTFCGSAGVELCEPLSFKGRMGSGLPGDRTGYKDSTLLRRRDWQKFAYTYRVWGRGLYNPASVDDSADRYLSAQFDGAARDCRTAMANATRILPLITLCHTPTASNNSYWPEIYENMSVVHEAPYLPYGYELFKPARYGTVGSCDPQLFMSPAECAAALVAGEPVDRIAPLTWANWLETLSAKAVLANERARAGVSEHSPELRRFSADVTIHAAIGRFFAEKTRAAVLWEIFLLLGAPSVGDAALCRYRLARDAWAVAAEEGRAHYVPDLTYGPHSWLSGRWDDRLPAIDQDIADMVAILAGRDGTAVDGETTNTGLAAALIERVEGWSSPQQLTCLHSQPTDLSTGKDIALTCSPLDAVRRAGRLYFRHVNQAEAWQSGPLEYRDGAYHGAIPGDYSAAPYPLQYYFEFQDEGAVSLFPGLSESVAGQPYFTVQINKNTALQAG
ncbi:hypothetical protein EOI86_10130 [Hwanghaeella grinnelliae]|uniref:Uncharacterized protein n=1 Tax=Hwanghaeella grinnelliae TaxID=2500179 RepID=A0A437QYH3_9PROT|nr:hypothetical protein [Hwanghaeella grinnelliae]RVU39559.1 hypothetical protein EOI86_10130 [Hwanghaeella grinnelliae]